MNIFNALNKWVVAAIYVFLIVSFINGCNGCNSRKETVKLRKEVDSLKVELKKHVYTKEELDTRISIEGYEISKRMLYDQNAIVRTVMRPDDRMNEYDAKIKELREKLRK